MNPVAKFIASVLNRNLVFIHGKGGVGKTSISYAISKCLAEKQNTLWVTLEDPTLPLGKYREIGPQFSHLNCDFYQSFEEYAFLKIGASQLTRIFLKNKVIRYLAQAAPGIHDLVLLGKIWFQRNQFSHVVVDMPSTGYGLALFQCTENFSKLFQGGPLHRDAESMLNTFRDPQSTGHLIVALPEEMPLRESIELNEFLAHLFPQNAAAFMINRVFPAAKSLDIKISTSPQTWESPFAVSSVDYALKRAQLEHFNMRIWRDIGIHFGELEYIPPPPHQFSSKESLSLQEALAQQLKNKAYV